MVARGEIDALLPRGTRDTVKGRIVYRGPVPAPVKRGQEVGTLQLTQDDRVVREAKVYAAADVGVGNTRQRALDGLRELLLGWW
jgi:D-alanyl-D-alanine carboxypeptidase (penicillin-binding protein 5/6)